MAKIRLSHRHDPNSALQMAVEKLELFTQSDGASLDIQENGEFICIHPPQGLDRIFDLTQRYLSPLFSEEARQERNRKILSMKQALLDARDIVQSHAALIEKLKQGDPKQQKLAQSILEIVHQYNHTVSQNIVKSYKKGYLKDKVLLDHEIQGKLITLPTPISIKYDSHASCFLQNSFKQLNEERIQPSKSKWSTLPIHKKANQVIKDAFRMKAIRMIQAHLVPAEFIPDALSMLASTVIDMYQEQPQEVQVKQTLHLAPGFTVHLSAVFERMSFDVNLMTFPVLKSDSFHLSLENTQTGFPYPAQCGGWSLNDALMNASPLREGMPLFQHIDQQKKKLAHDLLFNTMQRKVAKALADHIQLIWQQNSNQFLELHRELTQAILKACPYFSIPDHVLDSFYTYMAAVENPFLTLCQLQEKLVTLFIDIPLKKLQDTWLDIEESVTLRTGNSQEKYAIAFQLMFEEEKRILQHLPTSEPTFAFFHFLGSAIGGAARQIHLQYLSEKIGFAPPLLGYFEELIQLSAFQQFLTFHEDMQRSKLLTCQDLIKRMQTHIDLFCRYNTKDFSPYYPILEELKNYFNSRLEKNKK